MDGTLVDSMGYWNRLVEEYLRRKGVTPPPDLWRTIQVMTMPQSSAWLIKHFGIDGTPASVEAEMNAVMADHYRHDILSKPGVRGYLTGLRRRGVKLCVASNTPAPLVHACLGRLELLDFFGFCISGEEVGAGKDRPDIYMAAAARLGGVPENTAVYEDALFAIETARAAGFYTVGVYDRESAENWDAIRALADETVSDWEAKEAAE